MNRGTGGGLLRKTEIRSSGGSAGGSAKKQSGEEIRFWRSRVEGNVITELRVSKKKKTYRSLEDQRNSSGIVSLPILYSHFFIVAGFDHFTLLFEYHCFILWHNELCEI